MGHDQRPTVQVVEHSLRQIRFEPRPSLEAELLWRLRRGGEQMDDLAGVPHLGLLAVAIVTVGILIFLFWARLLSVTPGS